MANAKLKYQNKYQNNDKEWELRLTAQLAAWVLSPFSKKALSADDFIKTKGDKPRKSKEEYYMDLADMVEDFGLKEGTE